MRPASSGAGAIAVLVLLILGGLVVLALAAPGLNLP